MLRVTVALLIAVTPLFGGHPARAAAQGSRAEALWEAGRRVEAIEVWTERARAAPDDARLRMRLAEAQLAVHWYAAALESLAPLGTEADLQRAVALYRLARWEQALELLDPALTDQALMRIEALERLGRAAEADAEVERAAARLGPDDPRLLGHRARSLARRGLHAEAVEAYQRALRAEPNDGEALYGLGRALVALGRRDEGLQALERHRALTPLLDRLDFARRSVDLAPLHAPNLAALADAERALGHAEIALGLYERALELAGGVDVVPIALRHARLLTDDRGDVDGAVRVLEAAGERHPDARLYVRAGDVLMRAERPIDAVQRYFRASELRPQDPAIAKRIEDARAAYRRDPDR